MWSDGDTQKTRRLKPNVVLIPLMYGVDVRYYYGFIIVVISIIIIDDKSFTKDTTWS